MLQAETLKSRLATFTGDQTSHAEVSSEAALVLLFDLLQGNENRRMQLLIGG